MSNDLIYEAFTHIQCGCGAKINSKNVELLEKFDKMHGSMEHTSMVMELKLKKADKNYV